MRKCSKITILVVTSAFLIATGCRISSGRTSSEAKSVMIVCPSNASSAEKLAAKEIRRYLYLRTGELVPIIKTDTELPTTGGLIVVGRKDRAAITVLAEKDSKLASGVNALKPQQYLLKTVENGREATLIIVGGDPIGTLYGAYRFAEHLGVRFYLHGDTIPDQRIALEIPNLNETGKPLFETRGIQPFHDFPEGPDWWNTDDYPRRPNTESRLQILHNRKCGRQARPYISRSRAPNDANGRGNELT